jgi:hypothetical protein
MPDTQADDEVYCPDCGLRWVADEGIHTRGCRHLDLAKRPIDMDDEDLLRLALWLADGGERRLALWGRLDPTRARTARDYDVLRGLLGRLVDDCQDLYVALAELARTDRE